MGSSRLLSITECFLSNGLCSLFGSTADLQVHQSKRLDAIAVKSQVQDSGMVLTNFDGVGIGFGFGIGCGFGIGWGFGGMPLNALGLGAGGGCGVGLGLGWGFGTGFGSQYRSSRVTFQGVEFNRKSDNEGVDSDISKPKVCSS